MATSSDVILTVSLDGASAVTTSGIEADLGAMVQLSGANKSTWVGGAATRWEIYDYPASFALPSGWSEDDAGIYYYLGTADPPTFEVDPWGKYVCRVVVRDTYESQIIVSVLSPSGLEDIARKEGAEFGGAVKQWLAAYQANLRVIESSGGGGGGGTYPAATLTTTGTIATAGTVRLANNTTVQARNAANSANIQALAVTAGNVVGLGAAANATTVDGSTVTATATGEFGVVSATATVETSGLVTISAGGQLIAQSTGAAEFSRGGDAGVFIDASGNVVLDGTSLSAGSNRLQSVADPTSAQDAVTLAYLLANAPVLVKRSVSASSLLGTPALVDLSSPTTAITIAADTSYRCKVVLVVDRKTTGTTEASGPTRHDQWTGEFHANLTRGASGATTITLEASPDSLTGEWFIDGGSFGDVEATMVASGDNVKVQVKGPDSDAVIGFLTVSAATMNATAYVHMFAVGRTAD